MKNVFGSLSLAGVAGLKLDSTTAVLLGSSAAGWA